MIKTNKIIVNGIEGDLRQGGWKVSGRIDGDTDLTSAGQNLRLMGKSNAGRDDTEYREIFNGHMLHVADFGYDTFGSETAFVAGTANYLMQGVSVQDIAFTEQGSPANDHQIAATMRLSSIFNHITQRHCNFIFNATETPDGIIFNTDINTSDTAITRFNFRENPNLWNALVQQLGGGEEGGVQFFRPFCKRTNELVYQGASLFRSPALTSKGTLTKEHLRGKVRVKVRNSKPSERVGQVQIVANASANLKYEAKFPATQPADGRIIVKNNGIWADSQARADTLAQSLYEWLTRPYTLTVDVDPGLVLFGDDGEGLDLGDALAVTYDGPTEDTATGAGVHLNLSAVKFYVYKVTIRYDADGRIGKCTMGLEADN